MIVLDSTGIRSCSLLRMGLVIKDGIGDHLVRRLTCGGGKRSVGSDFKRFQLDGCVCGVVIGVRQHIGAYP